MINFISFSEIGDHAVNEDASRVELHPADPAGYLCFLADGQGGRAGGYQAAQLACEAALTRTKALPQRKLIETATWESSLAQADRAVFAEKEAGFTTLLGFYLKEDLMIGASSGDSAVLVKTGSLEAFQVTQNQYKNPPVGSGGARFVPFVERLKAPWSVLAMSDGVWKYVGWKTLIETIASLRGQALIDKLQEQARLTSGRFPDDFTIVLFES
jgi:serine/threonine protein phosphatase PrpC